MSLNGRQHGISRSVDPMPYISVKSVSKSYQNRRNGTLEIVPALDRLSAGVTKGETLALFGPNACGKTTILNIMASLLKADEGEILIGQKPCSEATVGYVFQNYADSLFPWRTVLDNVAFPLEMGKMAKKERRRVVRSFLKDLSIDLDTGAFPYTLSGGQQQLVAIARALITNPDVLLMDEPFGSLDYETRMFAQDTFLRLQEQTAQTTIFVSHEVDEAIYVADRVALLTPRPGKIAEVFLVCCPRPRHRSMMDSDAFTELKARILRLFHSEIGYSNRQR